MPVALVTGAARANSIAAGIVPRLTANGWEVVTSDLSSPSEPTALIERVERDHGTLSGLVLSHAHDVESGILDTTRVIQNSSINALEN